jgi:hypothetical protein
MRSRPARADMVATWLLGMNYIDRAQANIDPIGAIRALLGYWGLINDRTPAGQAPLECS